MRRTPTADRLVVFAPSARTRPMERALTGEQISPQAIQTREAWLVTQLHWLAKLR